MNTFRFLALGQRLIEKGAWFFAPLSWIWGLLSHIRHFLYDSKLLPITSVQIPVLSVGNLVAGGTGKTPLVHFIASQFPGKNVAILSRGYGTIADEALLLQRKLPQAKVYVGKDRVTLARTAEKEGADLVILDDGFQYRKLSRDFDFVTLFGPDPFGKGHYLPWGFLRDSPRRLKQASQVFVVDGKALPGTIALKRNVEAVRNGQGKSISVHSMEVAIFCGIAKPQGFVEVVRFLGATSVGEWFLADHEPVDAAKLKTFACRMEARGAKALLCTEKDFVKLPPLDLPLPVYFVEISLAVVAGEATWRQWIEKIAQNIDNHKICKTK